MSLFKKDPVKDPKKILAENIARELDVKDLWSLCRGNFDFLIEAVAENGSFDKIASALRKVGKYSCENTDRLLLLHQEYINPNQTNNIPKRKKYD